MTVDPELVTTDPTTWPDWYLAGSLRCVAWVIEQRPGMDDAELVRVWRAYTAGRT